MVHPLNAMIPSPGVDKAILEMIPIAPFNLPGSWCMVWDEIYSFNPCVLVQVLIRPFLKWVPLSDSILSGVTCLQRTCFSRDGVLSSGVKHRVGLQPSSGGFHHGQYIVLALAGLRQCDVCLLYTSDAADE